MSGPPENADTSGSHSARSTGDAEAERLTLVVLAAGLSRRFGRSKVLEPVGPSGEALPQYTVHDAMCAGFDRVVFVVHPGAGSLVRDRLGARLPAGIEAEFVPQTMTRRVRPRDRPWGTGAAVLAAAPAVTGPFAVANADDLYGRRAFEIAAAQLRPTTADGAPVNAIIGFRLRATLSPAGGVSRAICRVRPDGTLDDIEEVLEVVDDGPRMVGRAAGSGEPRSLRGDELVSMNLWAFRPEFISRLEAQFERFIAAHGRSADAEFLIGDAVRLLVAAGVTTFAVIDCDSPWCGITHPGDRELLVRTIARMVERGHYPSPLPGHL